MIRSSTQSVDVAISKRLTTTDFDHVVTVSENIDNVNIVAGLDLVSVATQINNIMDFSGITAETTAAGSGAVWDNNTKTLYIPRGDTGAAGTNGTNGLDGADGYTPVKGVDYFDGADGADGNGITDIVLVSKVNKTATYRVNMDNGNTFTFYVYDGQDGANGQDGAQGPQGPQGIPSGGR